jgi:hypothetical protein
MKLLPRSWRLVWTLALGGALLSACATGPQARPGVYVNQQHGFSVDYPENWQSQPPQHREVFRAASPTQHKLPVVTASVTDQPKSTTLDPRAFTAVMQQLVPGSSGYQILSQEDVTLNDSTPAKAFIFEWLWSDGKTKMVTAALITIKGGKYYNATVTNAAGAPPPPEQLLGVVKSWKFH